MSKSLSFVWLTAIGALICVPFFPLNTLSSENQSPVVVTAKSDFLTPASSNEETFAGMFFCGQRSLVLSRVSASPDDDDYQNLGAAALDVEEAAYYPLPHVGTGFVPVACSREGRFLLVANDNAKFSIQNVLSFNSGSSQVLLQINHGVGRWSWVNDELWVFGESIDDRIEIRSESCERTVCSKVELDSEFPFRIVKLELSQLVDFAVDGNNALLSIDRFVEGLQYNLSPIVWRSDASSIILNGVDGCLLEIAKGGETVSGNLLLFDSSGSNLLPNSTQSTPCVLKTIIHGAFRGDSIDYFMLGTRSIWGTGAVDDLQSRTLCSRDVSSWKCDNFKFNFRGRVTEPIAISAAGDLIALAGTDTESCLTHWSPSSPEPSCIWDRPPQWEQFEKSLILQQAQDANVTFVVLLGEPTSVLRKQLGIDSLPIGRWPVVEGRTLAIQLNTDEN